MRWHHCARVALLAGSAVLAACASPSRAVEAVAPPPVDAFFGQPAIDGARLSPSGRKLAVTAPTADGRNALVVLDLAATSSPTIVASYTDIDIRDFYWVNEDRLVFDVLDQDQGSGEREIGAGLFSVKASGAELRQLVKLRDMSSLGSAASGINDRRLSAYHELLHVPAGGGNEVIVGEWRYRGDGEIDSVLAKRLDVATGTAKSLSLGMPAHGFRMLFDADGTPRLVGTRHQGREKFYWRGREQADWTQIGDFDALNKPWTPRQIDSDGRLYVQRASGAAGELELVRFDFKTGQPEPKSLVTAPGFDADAQIVAEAPGARALGVRLDTDAETTVWFDTRLKAVQADVDARLPGRINRLSCRRCGEADMTVLVASWSDREPHEYWVWRDAAAGAAAVWQRVGRSRAGIDPRQMGTLDLHRIKARDGRDLPVWVTRPPAGVGGQKPAAVVLVHGGPWLRGVHWRWNPVAQFLASRGYLVIEPEFRGSDGYGLQHLRAGFKQWGQAMQDDVADATVWATGKFGADAKRVCIAGASYGGYSALMGLVRHPELYRCGVAWVAVTDPRLMFKWSRTTDVWDEFRQVELPAWLGDPRADAQMLEANAPVAQAARIKAPLLLAFGGSDRRVPLEHGTRLRDALTAAGKPPEWVLYPSEGHGWQKRETRFDFARRMEAFLARELR